MLECKGIRNKVKGYKVLVKKYKSDALLTDSIEVNRSSLQIIYTKTFRVS